LIINLKMKNEDRLCPGKHPGPKPKLQTDALEQNGFEQADLPGKEY